jgi:hypothetical protein
VLEVANVALPDDVLLAFLPVLACRLCKHDGVSLVSVIIKMIILPLLVAAMMAVDLAER